MKGGYQILILSAITLVADTETTITDSNILNQLLGLTDFLNKDGLVDKQLKPILIITKDSAGFVSITNPEANKLLIDGYIRGKHIQLNIIYTSSLDDYGNTVYAISSAKYLYNAALAFEDIVDKDGHARFAEYEIETETISGLTWVYDKASLSGSHLMIVLAGTVANSTVLSSGSTLAQVKVPAWIYDKLSPIFSNNIALLTVTYYADDWTTQTAQVSVKKENNVIKFVQSGALTLSADRNYRIVLDLLIDNE